MAVGDSALASNTTGASNVAVGVNALSSNVSNSSNTALGTNALAANTADGLSAFGYNSLHSNKTGVRNSAFGYSSLGANQTGSDNSAFGYGSLQASTGDANSAFGYLALGSNTLGGYNSAFGMQALTSNTTGTSNSAFGQQALYFNSSGFNNTAVGGATLANVTTGSNNTAIGTQAGSTVTTGLMNTFIGASSGTDLANAGISHAVAIGYGSLVTASNAMALGGTLGSGHEVNVGIGTSAPNTRLQVMGDVRVGTSNSVLGCVKSFNGGAIAGTCSSDIRLKTNIRPFAPVLDRVTRLQPVQFAWRVNEFPDYHFGDGLEFGLIAQDVERVFPEMVATDEHGFKMVNYAELPYLTLASTRELKEQNDALRAKVDDLEVRLRRLTELAMQLQERK